MDENSLLRRWKAEIKLYEREYKTWMERGKKVVERFLDERPDTGTDGNAKFNILWSNIETLFPAIYARMPKPEVSRRFKDSDPVGRVASLILERCIEFENEQYDDFHAANQNALMDRLLPGRGIAWVRYEPKFVEVPVEIVDEQGQVTEDVEERLEAERAPIDYVNWQDFGHSTGRRWEEVRGVWRRIPLDKDELEERFGPHAEEFGYSIDDIPLDYEPENLKDKSIPEGMHGEYKRAIVYEVWDKKTRKVIWLHEAVDKPLDVREDPLQLDGFFPCPKPLLATTSTGSLVPVPDYCLYQDQARELDEITMRIGLLQKAVKVVGVYDASQTNVQRMLNEGVNNTLIPVDTWAAFAEKGGIKGTVDFLPLDQVIQALASLYEAREQVKQVIYEITGIADIVRGATEASETATAQQIKSNFASLRIVSRQGQQAEFARDLIRLRSEIICNLYSDETILQMAGVELLSPEDQQVVPQALQLLRNDVLRDFRIDIETDSMVHLDEQAEKESRVEFLNAVGGFLQSAMPIAMQAPPLIPVVAELLKFGVRGFPVGKSIESVFETAMEQLKNPQPSPEQQAAQQAEQAKLQAEQQKAQAGVVSSTAKAQADMAKAQATQVKAQADVVKSQNELQTAQIIPLRSEGA